MEIFEQDDLIIATVSRDEAEHGAWERADRPVDVVRLLDVEGLGEDDRDRLGFLTRPRWLNWWAPLGASEEEFIGRLSGTERRNIRLGRQAVRDENLSIIVRPGLTEEAFDEFLAVYDAQLAGMTRGKDYARRSRDYLLGKSSEHMTVFVHDGQTVVVASIWWIRTQESVLQLRFSAAAPSARSSRVMRATYTEAFRYARESGLSYASLGNDPSLFGHVVQPGLFNFKSRLGFSVIPSEALESRLGGVFTDRFVSLRSLSDPTLVITTDTDPGHLPSWPPIVTAPSLGFVLLSGEPAAAAGAFRTEGFRSSRTLTVK
ncbi:GNAT family N-acetyltransferase [Streptomyces sp. SID5606]|uniref:GNAT family N-acetyltransferase n=1 Tax=Streptomyces sp. SID5606 TaxID=2690305 RepID=UPI00136E67B0|nr:GNAT family N-acetyltransferase [Streptomyces sp. SID5606]MZD56780.1 hypothetical protein [Streptomyces sp. SID5606]